jgi:hypothetical protein
MNQNNKNRFQRTETVPEMKSEKISQTTAINRFQRDDSKQAKIITQPVESTPTIENTQPTAEKPRLLTLKQAAALISGLTVYRVRRLCVSGELRHHKFGNKFMISAHELYKFFGVNG